MARSLRPRSGAGQGPIRMLERTGLSKGLAGSRGWFYVGTGLWTLRTMRRLAERREEVLISEQLRPGERIIIANGRATIDAAPGSGPASGRVLRGRRGRRAAKAAVKAERRSR